MPKRGDDIMSTEYYMPTKEKVLEYNIIMCFRGELVMSRVIIDEQVVSPYIVLSRYSIDLFECIII